MADEGKSQLKPQASTPSLVTVVTTAEGFLAAVAHGRPHIEIQAHLNLSTATPIDAQACYDYDDTTPCVPSPSSMLGSVPESVQSITGNCVDPPEEPMTDFLGGAFLLPRDASECLLVTPTGLIHGVGSRLWLDGLYVRLQRALSEPQFYESIRVLAAEQLWMSNVKLQGNGDGVHDCQNCGVTSWGSIYAEGVTLANLDGENTATKFLSPGTASFVNCTFASNTFDNSAALPTSLIAVAVETDSDSDSLVSLQGCTMDGVNIVDHALILERSDSENSAMIFSDVERHVWAADSPGQVTLPLDAIPDNFTLLSGQDEWLLRVQKDLPGLPREDYVGNPGLFDASLAPTSSNGMRIWEFVRFSFVAAVLVAVTVLVFSAVLGRQRRLAAAAQHADNSPSEVEHNLRAASELVDIESTQAHLSRPTRNMMLSTAEYGHFDDVEL